MAKQQDWVWHSNPHKSENADRSAPVSVVIPCYCCSNTIGRALASVAAQTKLPHEVLLIEDSSSDEGKTLAALRYLADRYGDIFEVKIIALNENGGAASARNLGWEAASQPYIAFLDGDDAWHPLKIECQYEYMRAHPDVTLCGHAYHLSNPSEERFSIPNSITVESIGSLRLLLFNPFVTPSVMVKTRIPFRFLSGQRYTDDHLLWMEIALAGLSVVKLSAPLAQIHKELFGEAGLSSHMWAMEKSELYNYRYLHETNRIGLPVAIALEVFSLIKYVRRLMIMGGRCVSAWAQKSKQAT